MLNIRMSTNLCDFFGARSMMQANLCPHDSPQGVSRNVIHTEIQPLSAARALATFCALLGYPPDLAAAGRAEAAVAVSLRGA